MSDKEDLKKAKQQLLRSLTKITNKNKRLVEKTKKQNHITQIFNEE